MKEMYLFLGLYSTDNNGRVHLTPKCTTEGELRANGEALKNVISDAVERDANTFSQWGWREVREALDAR